MPRSEEEEAARREERITVLLAQLQKVDWEIVLEDLGDTALDLLEGIIPDYVIASESGRAELQAWYQAATRRFQEPGLAAYEIYLNADLNRETLQWLVEEADEEDIIAWVNGELE